MGKLPVRTATLALALAACGSGNDGPALTPVDCAWLAGDNCWRASVAVATACTDGTATGTLDAATTSCSYEDGTKVLFDPSASVSAMRELLGRHQRTPWDFTVVTSTATPCARWVETATSMELATELGTVSLGWESFPFVLTCPDGSRFSVPWSVEACAREAVGWQINEYHLSGLIEFILNGAPPGDELLWRCR